MLFKNLKNKWGSHLLNFSVMVKNVKTIKRIL
jgi:hypothetical protein